LAKITILINRDLATKILLLSDTHGHIDDKVLAYCREADEVWHAGDIGDPQVTDRIQEMVPLRAVYGNIDGHEIRSQFPLDNRFTVEEVEVWITHIGGYPGRYEPRVREVLRTNPPKLFIAGHSHILKVMYDKPNQIMYMNPGAAGKFGPHRVRTAMRCEILGDKIKDLEVMELT